MHDMPLILLWLPPAHEHALARTLGLVEHDRPRMLEITKAVRADMEARGHRVEVLHSRCQAVVQAMSILGAANTADGRAAAYLWLWERRRRA